MKVTKRWKQKMLARLRVEACFEIVKRVDPLPVGEAREVLMKLRGDIDQRIEALDEQIAWAEGAAS